MTDNDDLKRAWRKGWYLVIAGLIYTFLFFAFTLHHHPESPTPEWDMGGTPFVPASSPYATEYPMHMPDRRNSMPGEVAP